MKILYLNLLLSNSQNQKSKLPYLKGECIFELMLPSIQFKNIKSI